MLLSLPTGAPPTPLVALAVDDRCDVHPRVSPFPSFLRRSVPSEGMALVVTLAAAVGHDLPDRKYLLLADHSHCDLEVDALRQSQHPADPCLLLGGAALPLADATTVGLRSWTRSGGVVPRDARVVRRPLTTCGPAAIGATAVPEGP